MNLFQGLVYFVSEAALNLARGWRVSLLAVLTIAVSLYVGGIFVLLSSGVSRSVEGWRSEARVVIYASPESTAQAMGELATRLDREAWVAAVEMVEPEEAQRRFDTAFPRLAPLLGAWVGDTLPRSLEVRIESERIPPDGLGAWIGQLRAHPEVEMVDDDREWLDRVDFLAGVLKAAGLSLGALLITAAVFTIASVIRMTAHVYRQEITVQRLVGGTELFIRGPFVAEGALQGLLGGLLAAAALLLSAHWLAMPDSSPLFAHLVPLAGPSWLELSGLVALGFLAGLTGALLSVRSEGGAFG